VGDSSIGKSRLKRCIMEKIMDYRSGIEVHKKGYRALIKELGIADFIRFIQEFEKGEGDYTKDRHKWQDKYSVEEIVKEIKDNNV
jgi:hypothetical protein